MVAKRMNVLVYAGYGTTNESVRHCMWTLRRLLSPNYAVSSVKSETLIKEPWTATCALLVIPGGADLGYCHSLNGDGNRRIKQYVSRGGAYLGFCAGGYYGSKRCEFEVGDPKLEVVGERELAFFPDICRGLAYRGFVYSSEAGARAVRLRVNKKALSHEQGVDYDEFRSYYNGGGVFVNAEKYVGKGVDVLASYADPLDVDSEEGSAAVVYCKIGEGGVVLTGPHPEFAPQNLNRQEETPGYLDLIDALQKDNKLRIDFLQSCLKKLGLQVTDSSEQVPSLSDIHLTARSAAAVTSLITLWSKELFDNGGQVEWIINGEDDVFHVMRSSEKYEQVKKINERTTNSKISNNIAENTPDLEKAPIQIYTYEQDLLSNKETPFFNHHAYFANLNQDRKSSMDVACPQIGDYLLYGEVVTSTNTLLENNPTLLQTLPNGLTFTATTQLAGRGRGSNVWVSPPGSLMFSTVLRHSFALAQSAPVIFVQYLIGLAIVDGIKTYEPLSPTYRNLPVKLKWPNDIYARVPASSRAKDSKTQPRSTSARGEEEKEKEFVKIGGILVNSTYTSGDYTLVVGAGLNVANEAPTTSLNALAAGDSGKPGLPPFQLEKLLARILECFQSLYDQFCREGWSRELEGKYYEYWLHGDQVVTLEKEGGLRARIKGITKDWGLLMAEELGWEDRPTGKIWQLQSDSNSFDFFKGLIKQKV